LITRFKLVFFILFLTIGLFAAVETRASDVQTLPESWKIRNLQSTFAVIDSLIGIDELSVVNKLIAELMKEYGNDPAYGGPLQARMGVILTRSGKLQQAIVYLENAIRLDPREATYHRNFASALMAAGKKGRGLSEYRLALQLAPGDAAVHREYGQSLTELRAWDDARSELEIAEQLCGGCPESIQALANLFLVSKNYSSAIKPLRKLLDLSPTSPAIRHSLAVSLSKIGETGSVVELLLPWPYDQLSSDELILLAEADLESGSQKRSLEWTSMLKEAGVPTSLSDIPALMPGLPGRILKQPHFWRTVSLNLLNGTNYEEGLIAADLAIILDPGNVIARNNRVVLLEKLGRQNEAVLEWEKVLELDPGLEEDGKQKR